MVETLWPISCGGFIAEVMNRMDLVIEHDNTADLVIIIIATITMPIKSSNMSYIIIKKLLLCQ